MAADDGKIDNGRINGGIAHHEFPTQVMTEASGEAEKARALLKGILERMKAHAVGAAPAS